MDSHFKYEEKTNFFLFFVFFFHIIFGYQTNEHDENRFNILVEKQKQKYFEYLASCLSKRNGFLL